MKKGLVIIMALALLFAMSSMALAKQDPAGDKGNIVANEYTFGGTWDDGYGETMGIGAKDWNEKEQGVTTGNIYEGNATSTHVYGTWNSPYTAGIDGYNYNDAQDYTATGTQEAAAGSHIIVLPMNPMMQNALLTMMMPMAGSLPPNVTLVDTGVANPYYNAGTDLPQNATLWQIETVAAGNFQSGPHGGYLTSTHRCRECHAVHRAAGKFKLLRSDTRFEACDWCHGTGAGSGYNIQMDNDDNYTTEYNVGHTMGYGIQSGKWKAPDDTYPAFTPNYWQGGFSCFDCHSPHANPARMLGYDQDGKAIESIVDVMTGQTFNLGNPGHDMYTTSGDGFATTNMAQGKIAWVPALGGPLPDGKSKPYYLAGSWLLIKNPDKEIATTTETVNEPSIYDWDRLGFNPAVNFVGDASSAPGQINPGTEIPDTVVKSINQFDSSKTYPVNKVPIDWNNPIGSASITEEANLFGMAPQSDRYGEDVRNPFCRSLIVDEFCTDCHDGNAGLHTVQAPLFSEDRALRGTTTSGSDGNTANDRAHYDLAYGHDSNTRH